MDIAAQLIIILVAIAFQIWLYFIAVPKLARERNRSPIMWFILGFIITPYGVIFLLWLLGQKKPKIKPQTEQL